MVLKFNNMFKFLVLKLNDKKIFNIWGIFFVYSVLLCLAFQLVILPYILPPEFYWGNGQMTNGDWLVFQYRAEQVFLQIKEFGWSSWQLKPSGWGITGVISLVYGLFDSTKTFLLIPVHSALHALGATSIVLIIERLGVTRSTAFLSALPYLIYPTSLLWVTQLMKDIYTTNALLLALFGIIVLFSFLKTRPLRIQQKDYISSILSIVFGISLVWLIRPYMVSLFTLFAMATFMVLTFFLIFSLINKKITVISFFSLIILQFSLIIFMNNLPNSSFNSVPVLGLGTDFSNIKSEKNDEELVVKKEAIALEISDELVKRNHEFEMRLIELEQETKLLKETYEANLVEKGSKVVEQEAKLLNETNEKNLVEKGSKAVEQGSKVVEQGSKVVEQEAKLLKETNEKNLVENDLLKLEYEDKAKVLIKKMNEARLIFEADVQRLNFKNEGYKINSKLVIDKNFDEKIEEMTTELVGQNLTNIEIRDQDLSQLKKARIHKQWISSGFLPTKIDNQFNKLYNNRTYFHQVNFMASSTIDYEHDLNSFSAMLRYIPRATQVAFLAPFPSSWSSEKRSSQTSMFSKIVGIEMIMSYFLLVGTIYSLYLWRRKIELWIIISYSLFFGLIFSYAFPNVGTLVRYRYGPLMLLVALGISALVYLYSKYKNQKLIIINE